MLSQVVDKKVTFSPCMKVPIIFQREIRKYQTTTLKYNNFPHLDLLEIQNDQHKIQSFTPKWKVVAVNYKVDCFKTKTIYYQIPIRKVCQFYGFMFLTRLISHNGICFKDKVVEFFKQNILASQQND